MFLTPRGSLTRMYDHWAGAVQTDTVVQDWRYYREYLSADDVKKLAMDSEDEDGNNMRTCEFISEGGDKDWRDINGIGYLYTVLYLLWRCIQRLHNTILGA